ncbi:MAG TPA: Tex-like N-terminal domain-containing protein, partial [Thermoguttaceae bacterium]|nr:Tex-like N-terminal domain-containing protein [Thermoguttaceae bacterium]
MTEPLTINVRAIARSLRLSPRQVEAVVQLLEEGKTVPFIAWYRKDQTGGLEEEQIRRIHRSLNQAHLLAQRKEAILRNIDLQGKLTPELERQIRTATTTRRLEDLYLPYKPKKEGLAPTARARGLEPLAEEILQAAPSCANLEARAADFVNPDKQVHTPADALLGAGHILAEMISEHADLRKKLREVFYQTARICAQRLETVPLPPEWEATKKTASPRPSSGSV